MMNTLHDLFEKKMQEFYKIEKIGPEIIRRRFSQHNISLTQHQIDILSEKLNNNEIRFEFDLEDNQQIGDPKVLQEIFDFTGSEQEVFEIHKEYLKLITEAIPEIAEEVARKIIIESKKDFSTTLKYNRNLKVGFYKRMKRDWRKPFNLFEAYIGICVELGENFNIQHRKEAAKNKDYVFETLTRLHARACQISNEILVLIQNGYSDGAMARWRSLHEITVVASFIKSKGNGLAEKYLLHEVVESYKAINKYNDYAKRLHEDAYPNDDVLIIKHKYDELLEKFGKNFKHDYGWASNELGIDRPTFYDLEKNVELDHHRPYYQMASYNVHANAKGIIFKHGLLSSEKSIMLTGPSNIGFTDPADCASISLMNITINLLSLDPILDNIVNMQIVMQIQSEIGLEFLKVQHEIEEKQLKLKKGIN